MDTRKTESRQSFAFDGGIAMPVGGDTLWVLTPENYVADNIARDWALPVDLTLAL